MLVYAMAARNDVNLSFFMSLLDHTLTLIDRKLEELNPQEQMDIHYLLAKKLPSGHPRKRDSTDKVAAYVTEHFQEDYDPCVFIKDFSIDFETARSWCGRISDLQQKISGFWELAQKQPSRRDECRQEVRSALMQYVKKFLDASDEPAERIYFSYDVRKNVACEFSGGFFVDTLSNVDLIEVELTQAHQKIESDPEEAFLLFKQALRRFKQKITVKEITALEWAYNSYRSTRDVEQLHSDMHRLREIEDTTNKLSLATKVVQAAILTGGSFWEKFLHTYLDLLDIQHFALHRKHTKELIRQVKAIDPLKAIAIVESRKRVTTVTAQMALELGDVEPRLLALAASCFSIHANSLLQAKTLLLVAQCSHRHGMEMELDRLDHLTSGLIKEDRALYQAYYARMLMQQGYKQKAERALQEMEQALSGCERDCEAIEDKFEKKVEKLALLEIIFKIVSILEPHFPEKALERLTTTLPKTEDASEITRISFLNGLRKVGPLKDALSEKMARIYQPHMESEPGYVLSHLASELRSHFPQLAKKLYEAADAKSNDDLESSIAIIQLSGENVDERLKSLFEKVLTKEKDPSEYTLSLILEACLAHC